MASVSFEHVHKKFGELMAVNDFNLHIADKEFLTLVGPSGCGKVTLLSCLAGFEKITSGRVLIGDRVVNDVEPKNRDIGMVFKSSGLETDLSVYENLVFPLKTRKVTNDQIDRLVKEVAEILNLTDLLERKPRQLSGAQSQRVALGRAMIFEPQVILFDDPLANLSHRFRFQMQTEIHNLYQRLQTTFVYVADDPIEAMAMSTRIAVINKGKLQQVDTPSNIYNKPANMFVAGFIGSFSMNFFPAKLRKDENKLVADCSDFVFSIPEYKTGQYIKYVNRNVVFGIRPKSIDISNFVPLNAKQITARVQLVEFMENELIIHLISGRNSMIAQGNPHYGLSLREGERVEVSFDTDNFYLFDAETEQVI